MRPDHEVIKENQEVYEERGARTREEYLQNLADEYNVDLYNVKMLAALLGPEEDFDGLVSELQDLEGF